MLCKASTRQFKRRFETRTPHTLFTGSRETAFAYTISTLGAVSNKPSFGAVRLQTFIRSPTKRIFAPSYSSRTLLFVVPHLPPCSCNCAHRSHAPAEGPRNCILVHGLPPTRCIATGLPPLVRAYALRSPSSTPVAALIEARAISFLPPHSCNFSAPTSALIANSRADHLNFEKKMSSRELASSALFATKKVDGAL